MVVDMFNYMASLNSMATACVTQCLYICFVCSIVYDDIIGFTSSAMIIMGILPYSAKHLRDKTFAVWLPREYSRKNFHGCKSFPILAALWFVSRNSQKNICSFKNNRERCKRFVPVMFLSCSNYWMFELVFCILAHHENAVAVVNFDFCGWPKQSFITTCASHVFKIFCEDCGRQVTLQNCKNYIFQEFVW